MKKEKPPACLHLFSRETIADPWTCRWCKKTWDDVYGVKPMKAHRKPNTTEDGRLACAFGEYWLGPHPLCQAETARIGGCDISDVRLPDYSRFDVANELTQRSLFEETA